MDGEWSRDRILSAGGSLLIIDFSEQGNSAHFRQEGWSAQERSMVWGIGPSSNLRLMIQPCGRPLILEAEIEPCRCPRKVTGQLVRVRVNGVALGWARLNQKATIRCEIDPAIIRDDGTMDIEFGFPGFFRPEGLRYSSDTRPLSGAFTLVRVYTKDLSQSETWCMPVKSDGTMIDLLPPHAETWNTDGTAPAIYTFGVKGTVMPFLRDGWHSGETRFTWTIATSCGLELPAPITPGPHVLRLYVTPLIVPDILPTQNLTISLDQIVIGQFTLSETTTLVVPLPRELVEGRDILPLQFMLPDASRPKDIGISIDTRLLGMSVSRISITCLPFNLSSIATIRAEQGGRAQPIAISDQFLGEGTTTLPSAVEAALGMSTATLLRGFESLGNNCEFGIVQRKLGLEVLNLFRFGNVSLANLMQALTDDLNAANDPSLINVVLNDSRHREYVLGLPTYNIAWHTFVYENDSDQQTVLRNHTVKLAYLRRKFYEGLRTGRKIYVIKRTRPISINQAAALLMELGRHGHATLLCVEQASPGRQPGEVELIMPGLMRGYINKFAPEDSVESADPTDWLRVIANATLLHRGPNAIFYRRESAD